jgi:tetratricopeptide (TPR) repeat protein
MRSERIQNAKLNVKNVQTRGILALSWLLLLPVSLPVFNVTFLFLNSPAAAQASPERKAEADRLLNQGAQQYQVSQFEAALQSWQQALQIYREIKDRQGEGNALDNLGDAYKNLNDYAKAIEFYKQSLEIAPIVSINPVSSSITSPK